MATNFPGGPGDDVYQVTDPGDTIEEAANAGYDTVYSTVSYVLPANVEKLVLAFGSFVGTGNDLDNVLLGNSEAPDGPFGIPRGNTLYGRAGNDILDGGAGLDQMYGGTGNDVYYVNAVATTPRGDIIFDRIYENKGEGTDTLYTRLSYAMPHNVEVGILQESARPPISPLFLIGNGADTLIGNSDGNIFYAAGTGFSYGYGAVVDGNVDIMIGGKGGDI